ncbi:MAG TPA: hypothetical protein VJJ21_05350 [Candidatus Nanoarchaeia archaeon]|nr:hypothetical protein [Candidatus Nanoarchaeia archaeon]
MKTPQERFIKETKKSIKQLAQLNSNPIQTEAFLIKHSLVGLLDARDEWKYWYGSIYNYDAKDKHEPLLIGGYGDLDVPYGAGPTRPVTHATYAVRTSQYQEDVPLTQGLFNGLTSIFEGMLSDMSSMVGEEGLTERVAKLVIENRKGINNPFILIGKSDAKLLKFQEPAIPTYAELILSNVRKQNFRFVGEAYSARRYAHREKCPTTYVGTVALHLVRQLGHGRSYMSFPKDYDVNDGNSRRTQDILMKKSPIADRLMYVVSRAKKELEATCHEFFDNSGLDRARELKEHYSAGCALTENKPITMLTVDNVYV